MPGALMVMNPRKKRRRKMTAKQAKYFGKRKRKTARKSARVKKRRAKVIIVSSNPKGSTMAKKRRRHRRRKTTFSSNPRRRVARRRFRRNPIEGSSGFLANMMAPAAIGAAGAIATDYLTNMLPLPASMNTPTMQPIIKIGTSILVGLGVDAVAGAKAGGEAAAGGIVVALYNFLNQQLSGMGMGQGQGGGYGQGYGGQGNYMNRYMGFLRSAKLRGMGAMRVRRRGRRLNGIAFNVNPRGLGKGSAPIGMSPLARRVGLGATSPNAVTKFRIRRNGGAGGARMGYIGPARTMGRYVR